MKGNFSKYRQKDKKNAASEPPGKFPSDSVTLDCGQQNSRILSDSAEEGSDTVVLVDTWHLVKVNAPHRSTKDPGRIASTG
ncbi:hypothetical protein TURU_106388 [Turdus rufiventris]|nr:hypothetical protein TURU_106388 [Turdus rufiventris]